MRYFWQHIVEACRFYELRLTKDINTPEGSIKSDSVLASESMDTLSSFVDATGIEQHLDLSPKYDGEVFKKDVAQLLSDMPSINTLFDSVSHNYFLNVFKKTVDSHACIGLRLAILKSSLPTEYQRTLFCAVWAIFDSADIQRADDSFNKLALVCLTHDFGLLDIERQVGLDDHDHRSPANEQPDYCEHVNHTVRFLKEHVNGVSPDVVKGVLQHHERLDGTGYPAGMSGVHLNEFGQIVHLYDSMFSIYQKFLRPLGKTLADLRLIISISALTHYGAPANRMLSLLEKIPRDNVIHFKSSDYENLIASVNVRTEYVEKSLEIIQAFTAEVGFRHESPQLFSVQNSFIHIALAHHKMSEQLQKSIKEEKEEGDQRHSRSGQLLEESYIVLREIIFHVDEFKGRLDAVKTQLESRSPIYIYANLAIKKLSQLNQAYLSLERNED